MGKTGNKTCGAGDKSGKKWVRQVISQVEQEIEMVKNG